MEAALTRSMPGFVAAYLYMMDLVSLEQWSAAAGAYNRLPFARRAPGARLPERWEPLLAGTGAILLESARDGRYTYFIPRPRPVAWTELDPDAQPSTVLGALRGFLARHRAPRLSGLAPF